MYIEKYLNHIPMNSGWASEEELAASGCVSSSWSKGAQYGGVVLYSKGDDVICDGGSECRHSLIFGATGSGKTRLVILPSLLRTLTAKEERSLVVFDVKGELEAHTAEVARSRGRHFMKINFRDPRNSDGWNPFAKVNSFFAAGAMEEGWRALEEIMAVIFNDGDSTRTDPFWRTSCTIIFRGICDVLIRGGKPLELVSIMKLSRTIPGTKENDDECELFRIAQRLPKDSIAHSAFNNIRYATDGTRGNIMACYYAYLSCLTAREDVMQMVSGNESVDFKSIGRRPTILYISIPDDSTATGALQALLLTQMQKELNEEAMLNGGTLPVRTDIYVDELCNIRPKIPALDVALTIARSRGMRYVLAVQSYAQLVSVYGDMAENIAANCATWIALAVSKDETFRSKLSALCGSNAMGDHLITPSQLALLPYGNAIVIRERCRPFYTCLTDVGEIEKREETTLLYNGNRFIRDAVVRRRKAAGAA